MFLFQTLNIATIIVWLALAIMFASTLIRKARLDGIGSAFREITRWRNLGYLLLAFAFTILARSLVFVQPQEVGVVISLISANGYRDRPLRSGLHWIPPLLEEVRIYPISWQTYTMSHKPVEGQRTGDDAIIARSADGQEVAIDCSIIYQLIPDQVARINIEWQNRYQEDFVRAVVRGVVRSITSNYRVEEINSDKRQDIERQINDELRTLFQEKGFALDRFVLRNVAFSPEFAASIERKQIELEGVQRSQHEADQVRLRAQGEADAVQLKAKAEADALRQIAAALEGNPGLLSYRYIDKIAPNIRVMLLPNNSPYILPLNDTGLANDGTLIPTPTPMTRPGATEIPGAVPTITPTAPVRVTLPAN